MSIIERVAELLGSDVRTQPTPPSRVRELDIREPGLVDRAVSEFTAHSGLIEPSEFAPRLEADGLPPESKSRNRPTLPERKTTQTLKIDPDRLRRQRMITPDGERTPISESFRRVKRQILANVANLKSGAPANHVLVTSALAGEGKTFCAVNLAISIALEINHTVLLVDADVALPSIPQVLGLKAERGLMDVLLDRRLELSEVLWSTDIGKLSLLPAGTSQQHATELLASGAMRELLREMSERYHDRIIIFDSPPLLAASEAGALASQMGQIVMVVEAGKTSESALKDALGRIEQSKITGLLLNKGQSPGQGYGYRRYA
jgi:exopolysaccharide/PEP-CTERM locus tyrosine autokinase